MVRFSRLFVGDSKHYHCDVSPVSTNAATLCHRLCAHPSHLRLHSNHFSVLDTRLRRRCVVGAHRTEQSTCHTCRPEPCAERHVNVLVMYLHCFSQMVKALAVYKITRIVQNSLQKRHAPSAVLLRGAWRIQSDPFRQRRLLLLCRLPLGSMSFAGLLLPTCLSTTALQSIGIV